MIAFIREALESLEPIRLGQSFTFTLIIGYATLISYTWPYGFLPLVAIEALPVLILSFIPCLAAVWLILWFIFYPIALMSNARYWATTLRAELAYNERDEALNKAAKRIATQSFKRTYSEASTPAFSVTPHWLAFGWDLFMSLVLCVPAFAAWYAISAAISFNRLVLVLGSPVLYLAYRSFGWLMRARTVKDGIEPFSIILCTVVLLPTISFEDPKQYWFKFVPNPIVRQALEWAGLGGELSVQVRGEDVGNPTAGHLIFFDGTRAWVRPCTSEAGAIIQTSTIALSYFPKDICR